MACRLLWRDGSRCRSPPHHWLRVGGNDLVQVIGCPRLVSTTRAATRPFKSACHLLWRDGSQLKSRQHVGSQQRTFPPQEGYKRTCIGKWRRGDEDDGNVLKFDVGVIDRQDNVNGLVLVIIIVVHHNRPRPPRQDEVHCCRCGVCHDRPRQTPPLIVVTVIARGSACTGVRRRSPLSALRGRCPSCPPPSLARADPSCSTSLPPVSGCPQSPPVVDDEAAFAVGVGTEEVPLPSERTRRAQNSLQSPAAPSSELIGSSDDGPPPSPSPPDNNDEHECTVVDVATARIERVGCGRGGERWGRQCRTRRFCGRIPGVVGRLSSSRAAARSGSSISGSRQNE